MRSPVSMTRSLFSGRFIYSRSHAGKRRGECASGSPLEVGRSGFVYRLASPTKPGHARAKPFGRGFILRCALAEVGYVPRKRLVADFLGVTERAFDEQGALPCEEHARGRITWRGGHR